jgi:hypothetical protein
VSTPESKPERERESSGRFVGGMVTPEQAADLLSRSRAGESQRALAAEVGCAPSYMHTILKRAADAEARANAPVRGGVQRTVRKALEAIINDANARHTDIVAAARALDALKPKTLDGETPSRPTSITLVGPVVCPHCGENLRDVRKSELADALAAMSARPDNDAEADNE